MNLQIRKAVTPRLLKAKYYSLKDLLSYPVREQVRREFIEIARSELRLLQNQILAAIENNYWEDASRYTEEAGHWGDFIRVLDKEALQENECPTLAERNLS
jgi:hypothetical protein